MRRAAEAFALVLGLVAVSFVWMDLLGDTFWSIAVGRWLLEHRALPSVDPFSFTARGTPWLVHMPLCQVVFAAIVDGVSRALGVAPSLVGAERPVPPAALTVLAAFGAVVEGAALALFLLPHARSREARLAGAALLGFVVWSQRADVAVRGQLFGDLCFALTLVLVHRIRDGKRVAAWMPVALGALWINLHPSFFLVAVVPLAFGALDRAEGAAATAAWSRLVVFAALGLAGSLVNPYGPALVVDSARLLASPSTSGIDLFLPPAWSDAGAMLSLALVLVLAVYLLQRRAPLAEIFFFLLLACAGAAARRWIPLATCAAIVSALRHTQVPPFRFATAIGLALVAVALGGGTLAALRKDPYRDVPADEAAALERAGAPADIAHPYHWGGYLDFAWHERRRVMVDGRNQIFDGAAFDAVHRLTVGDHPLETLFAYRINTVLAERGSPLERALRGAAEWQLVTEGRLAAVYARREPLSTPDASR